MKSRKIRAVLSHFECGYFKLGLVFICWKLASFVVGDTLFLYRKHAFFLAGHSKMLHPNPPLTPHCPGMSFFQSGRQDLDTNKWTCINNPWPAWRDQWRKQMQRRSSTELWGQREGQRGERRGNASGNPQVKGIIKLSGYTLCFCTPASHPYDGFLINLQTL